MVLLFSLAHASALEVHCLLQSVGELILLLLGRRALQLSVGGSVVVFPLST